MSPNEVETAAAENASETPESVGFMVAVSDVEVDWKLNVSRSTPYTEVEYADLANEIGTNGLIHPITVRVNDAGKKKPYKLVAGYRRFGAYQLMAKEDPEGWGTVPAMLDGSETDAAAIIINLAENNKRKELSYLDSAHAIVRMGEMGYTDKQIADAFGTPSKPRSLAWVRERRKLVTELSPKEQKKLATGEIDGEAATLLARHLPEYRDTVLVAAEQIAAAEAKVAKAKAKEEKDAAADAPKSKAKAEPEKPTVKAKHVAEASRQTGAKVKPNPFAKGAKKDAPKAPEGPTRRRQAEVVAILDEQDGPGNSDPVRACLRAFKKLIEGGDIKRSFIKGLDAATEGSKFTLSDKEKAREAKANAA